MIHIHPTLISIGKPRQAISDVYSLDSTVILPYHLDHPFTHALHVPWPLYLLEGGSNQPVSTNCSKASTTMFKQTIWPKIKRTEHDPVASFSSYGISLVRSLQPPKRTAQHLSKLNLSTTAKKHS